MYLITDNILCIPVLMQNLQSKMFCLELHTKKCHPCYSDIRQVTSADELFEAYQSTTDPDLFQVCFFMQ